MRIFIWTSLATLLLLGGCVTTPNADLVPYTNALRAQHNLSDNEVSRLQFYLSDTLELQRQNASSNHRVENGRLVATANRSLERIVVDRGTPGIATSVAPTRLGASFSQGTQFAFSPDSRDPTAPYRLQATPTANGENRVFLYNSPYLVTSGSRLPYLLIDRETLYHSKEKTYRLPGRTLNQN